MKRQFSSAVWFSSYRTQRVLSDFWGVVKVRGWRVSLKMTRWARRIGSILTISTALLIMAIADGDKILHDTKQGRTSNHMSRKRLSYLCYKAEMSKMKTEIQISTHFALGAHRGCDRELTAQRSSIRFFPRHSLRKTPYKHAQVDKSHSYKCL